MMNDEMLRHSHTLTITHSKCLFSSSIYHTAQSVLIKFKSILLNATVVNNNLLIILNHLNEKEMCFR